MKRLPLLLTMLFIVVPVIISSPRADASLFMFKMRLMRIENRTSHYEAQFSLSDGRSYTVRKGDRLESWKVSDISENLVILADGDKTVRIRPSAVKTAIVGSKRTRIYEAPPPAVYERPEVVNGFRLHGIYGESSSRTADISVFGGPVYAVRRGDVRNGYRVTGLSKTTVVLKPVSGGEKVVLKLPPKGRTAVKTVPLSESPTGESGFKLAGIMKSGDGYVAIVQKGTGTVMLKKGDRLEEYTVSFIGQKQLKLTSPHKKELILNLSD